MTRSRLTPGWLAAVAMLVLAACQGAPRAGGDEATPDDAITRLHRAARDEAATPPESVALPPGVDPDALRLRDTPKSRMTVDEVLRVRLETAARRTDASPAEPPEGPVVAPEARRGA